MLNENDLHRYARQIIIQNFDEEGQEKILKTKCLIVGAGGLGCPVALYAAAAGFGHIEIYDEDFSWTKHTEEHTWQEHPIPLVFTGDTGRVLVKFGEVILV